MAGDSPVRLTPLARLRRLLARIGLPWPHGRPWAGAFNVVMATGIVSISCREAGLLTVSRILLWLVLVAYLPLLILDGRRAVHPLWLLRRARLPRHGFAAFGFVADACVLGTRLAIGGNAAKRAAAAVLLAAGAAIWLAVVILLSPLLGATVSKDPRRVLEERAQPSWLLAAVGTEGIAILAGKLATSPAAPLHAGGVVLWILGGLVYLAIAWLVVFGRRRPLRPEEFTPDWWILMGGMAIFAVAGATLEHGRASGGAGTVVLAAWLCASAWIPALVAGELWRISRLGRPRFTPERWTMVFPLGMYSVAAQVAGRSFGVGWLGSVGRVLVAVALAGWVAVAAGEVRHAFRNRRFDPAHVVG